MFTYAEKYQFTDVWFDPAIPVWEKVFTHYQSLGNSINSVLEVGCYEGRATVWLCENVLNEQNTVYRYDVVDTFRGTANESGMERAMDLLKKDSDSLLNRFKHNTSFFANVRFGVFQGESQLILPSFELKPTYDFIYIDASHKADDTLVDAYYANKLLKPGGLLIFDDYGWVDPKDTHPANSPKMAIDVFYGLYNREYTPIFSGYQVGLIKNK